MAEQLKAKVVIEGTADKSVKAAKTTQKELKGVGSEGKKAGDEVKRGSEKGQAGLQKLSNESKETKRDMTALGVSVLGLGQSISGLADGMVGLKNKMLDIHKAALAIDQSVEGLRRKKEDLTIAMQEGTMTAIQYERAISDISLTMKDLSIKEQEAKIKQEELGNEHVKFALNTANTVVFSVMAMSTAITGDTRAKIANALTTKGLTTATVLFSKALWKVAKHPAFIIAAAGIAIWESNLFGFRTELEKLSGTSLGIMDNMQTLIEGGFNPAAEATDELTLEMEKNEKEMREWAETLKNTTNPELGKLTTQANQATSSVLSLTRATDILKKKRPENVIASLVDFSLLSVSDNISEAVHVKGLIDQSMMSALLAAEGAGIIARGTAGQYRTNSGFNANGVIRAIHKANNHIGGFFNASGTKTFGSTPVNANPHSLSSASSALLARAQSSGQFKRSSSSATGSRNTKSEKDKAIRAGYASADFQLALRMGSAHQGAQKRHHAFRQIAQGQREGAKIRSVFEKTGIGIPTLNLRSTGRKGYMYAVQEHNRNEWATIGARIAAAYNEALAEIAAFGKLSTFNPNLNIDLTAAGIDRSYIESLYASEQSRFSSISQKLGISRTDIISLESSSSGNFDLNNMLDYHRRVQLSSSGVVT